MRSDYLVHVEKISGRNSGNRACGIFTKRVSVGDGDLGTMVACISIKSSAGEDLQTILGDIFELSVKKLEGTADGILNALEFFKNSAVEYARAKNLEVSFIFTFFFENVCYVVRFGKDVRLLVFEAPKSVEITFESGSGPIAPGQIYLIATDRFLSIFDTKDLSLEADIDFREIIDGIAVEIAGEVDQSEIGAAFVQINGTEGQRDTETEDTMGVSESVGQSVSEPANQKISESVDQDDRITDSPRYRNPLPGILGAIGREFGKLRHGDIGAVLRLRRNIVVLAILIFAILAGSIFFTLRQNRLRERAFQVEGYITNAASKLNEGAALIELNKTRAREVLVVADGEIKAALALDAKNQRARDLSVQIAAKLKETEISGNVNFETFIEVSSPLVALSSSGKNLVGVGEGKIFVINTGNKTSKELHGVSGAENGAVFDNKAFITTSEKIFRVDLATEQARAITQLSGAQDIGVFLGNVYLLFTDKIEKLVPVEGGYSGGTDYLSNPVNFGQKSRFAIDGSVWVTSGKQIYKFTRGEKQNFEISGLASDVSDLSLIYTNANLSNLYVIDSANSALLVVGRDGIYKRAYQSPEFARTVDFVISDSEDEMFVAVGSKILSSKL